MIYKTHVFDCDGVLLASNAGKENAFRQAAGPYGEENAAAMVRLHRAAGSISRTERWERFFENVLHREPVGEELDELVDETTRLVRLSTAQAAPIAGVVDYLAMLQRAGNVIIACVSGIDTVELDAILREHELAGFFHAVEGGNKREVLAGALARGAIVEPAVYYGDTLDDFQAAHACGLDFVYVGADSAWPRNEAAPVLNVGGTSSQMIEDFLELGPFAAVRAPRAPASYRVDREGFADINGERTYLGMTLAGATIDVPVPDGPI